MEDVCLFTDWTCLSSKSQLIVFFFCGFCLFCVSVSGKGFLAGHVDGRVVRYFFDSEGSRESQVDHHSRQNYIQEKYMKTSAGHLSVPV